MKLLTAFLTIALGIVFGQNAVLTPVPNFQAIDCSTGQCVPLVSGNLYSYVSGTVTPLATCASQSMTGTACTTANSNPVVFNSAGYNAAGSGNAGVWLLPRCYTLVLKNSSGVTIWTQDNVCTTGSAAIIAPTGSDLTLQGGGSGAAACVIGRSTDARIVCTPGTVISGGFEYFSVNSTTSTSALGGDSFGFRSLFRINSASTIAYHSAANLSELLIPSGSTTAASEWLAGGYDYVKHEGAGLLAEVNGTNTFVTTNGTGDITEATAFKGQLIQQTNTGRMVTGRFFYAPPFSNPAGSPKPTNLMGMHIQNQGADGVNATNTWAILTEGDSKVEFQGPVSTGALSSTQVATFTNPNQATSVSTGAVKISGGVGIAKNAWIGGIVDLSTNAGSDCSATGLKLGVSGECIFRYGAGNIRINAAGLYLATDMLPVTTATSDLGSTSLRWRQIWAGFVVGAYYSSDGSGGITGASCSSFKDGICVAP